MLEHGVEAGARVGVLLDADGALRAQGHGVDGRWGRHGFLKTLKKKSKKSEVYIIFRLKLFLLSFEMRRFALASTRGGHATTTTLVARVCAVARGAGGTGIRSCYCWRPAAALQASSSVAVNRGHRSIASAASAASMPPPPSSSSSSLPSLPPPIEPSPRGRMAPASSRSSPPTGSRGLGSSAGLGGDSADADGERRCVFFFLSLIFFPPLPSLSLSLSSLTPSPTTTKKHHSLILIDGTALLYRCYFSLGAGGAGGGAKLTSALTGQDTSVAHGFVSQLLRLLELDPAPTHAAAVFDAPGKTFRHALYPEYKGQRPPSPPAVAAAAPLVRTLLREALGVADLSAPGVEADDLIGTLAVRGVEEGLRVAVVSPDKDFYQLLRPGLQLLRPVPTTSSSFSASSSSKSSSRNSSSPLSVVTVAGLVPYTESTFIAEQEGLLPSQWADARALAGDPSDNIPGVAGIGAKTALTLIKKFGSLEETIERAAEIGRPSARAALQSEEGVRAARLSRRLLEIRTDLDLPPAALPWESLELKSPSSGSGESGSGSGSGSSREEALGALRELDMESSARRLEGVWEGMEARRRVFGGDGNGGGGGSTGPLLRPASELLAKASAPPPPPSPPPSSQQRPNPLPPPPSSSSRAAAA